MDSVSRRPAAPVRLLKRLSTFRTVPCIVYRHKQLHELAAGGEIRGVTMDSAADALSMDPPGRIEEFRRFLARGDRGYYGYVSGKVVHRSWLVKGPAIMPLWRRFGAWPVAAGEAYVHYCETSPEARGRGFYPAALSRIAHDAQAEGIRALFIATEKDNHASRRGIEKAGFAEIAYVVVRVMFGVGSQRVTGTGDRD
jgi:L-amino acid N-acyltransferase YncA